jgi:hypothetical protein
MHRTVATLRRPEPHVFVEDPDVPPDHKGRRFCRAVVNSTDGSGPLRCAFPEPDAAHIPAEEFYEPTPEPAREIDDRRMGESG